MGEMADYHDPDHSIRDGEPLIDEHEWVIEPATVHLHVGHHIEIVVYAERNLAIQCEDCGSLISDIDFEEV